MIDETGKKYGRLTVIRYDHTDKKQGAYWLCACDCGCTTVVKGNRLRSGATKSCGCLVRENATKQGHIQGLKNADRLREFNRTDEHRQQAREAATKHGGTKEHLFRIWSHIKERCNKPTGDHSRWYHDKGIKMCDEWNDYSAFREWAYSNGYKDHPKDTPHKFKLSIDRIDPKGNYEPSNCQWITVSENSIRRNRYYADQR